MIGSPIIAKAVFQSEQGGYLIAVVFQKSTSLEFYWVFRAKSPRSSRRSWKPVNFYPRDFAYETKPYRNFGSFVSYHASSHHLHTVSQKVMHKKRLSALLVKAEHQSIYGNWTPQNPLRMTQEMCRKRALRARSSRLAW